MAELISSNEYVLEIRLFNLIRFDKYILLNRGISSFGFDSPPCEPVILFPKCKGKENIFILFPFLGTPTKTTLP